MGHIQSLNCVPCVVRDKPRYVGDHVIRHYRPLGLVALLRDLRSDPVDHMTISGGIGTLTMFADGSEDWQPSVKPKRVAPEPRPCNPLMSQTRRAICASCSSYYGKCTAAGCGCAGEGKPEIWSSRCPLGKWPSIDCNP